MRNISFTSSRVVGHSVDGDRAGDASNGDASGPSVGGSAGASGVTANAGIDIDTRVALGVLLALLVLGVR